MTFELKGTGELSGMGRGQSYDYEAFATHNETGTRVRVFVHADTSYQNQAYANVQAWTSEGWSHITGLPTDEWYADMPSAYAKGKGTQALRAMVGIRDQLLEKADFVLTP